MHSSESASNDRADRAKVLRKGGGGSLRLEARLESVQLLDYFTPDTRFPQVFSSRAIVPKQRLSSFLAERRGQQHDPAAADSQNCLRVRFR